MEKENNPIENEISTILSVVLSKEERTEIKKLSDELGISDGHLGRALVRLALAHCAGISEEYRQELHLRLIRLGKNS